MNELLQRFKNEVDNKARGRLMEQVEAWARKKGVPRRALDVAFSSDAGLMNLATGAIRDLMEGGS
ncbi:MAG: hypothetical protein ACYTAN_18900 [Planctomycetota bacterium]|jgi:hypothetical protein